MTEQNATPGRPAAPADPRGRGPTRRGLVRWSGAAGAGALALPLLPPGARTAPATGADTGAPPAGAAAFDPVRPPATPLAVRSPYLSTWLPADNVVGTWPVFWTGRTTAMAGIARIDGVAYTFLGDPQLDGQALRGMAQRSLETTATRSRYLLHGGGVEITLTFLSPVETGDPRRQSMPLSYVTAQVRGTDGAAHRVSLYFDISAEWAHGDSGALVTWAAEQVPGTAGGPALTSLTCTPAAPQVLAESGDMAAWGTVVWSAAQTAGMTWQIGPDQVVRGAAANHGALADTADPDRPRAIDDRWPVFGFCFDLGTIRGAAEPVVLSIGHVREPAVSYLGTALPPLWRSYWPDWRRMTAYFHADATAAFRRADALDAKVRDAATRAAGPKYAALCALALRQAYGGTELVAGDGVPWAFLKEISSDGNVSTVDVTYPAMPAFLATDPAYLGMLLAPLLDYAEHGGWPKEYAEHDLGSSYPVAAGHNDGREEDMPVEESANMLIMTAAYLRDAGAAAGGFAAAHYPVLRQWADYLVANALDPGYQNQTDDFTGFIAHSANLALKGIVGIGAMGRIAAAAGRPDDAARYAGTARDYVTRWAAKAQDAPARHLKLAYDQPGTWSLKYNGYCDTLLGLGLVPRSVAAEEAAWYLSQANPYGVPLDIRHAYTKADWELWAAAWLHDQPVRDALIDAVYAFVHTSPSRVPFTDWYDTVTDRQVGFRARPVVGGVFALLSLEVNGGPGH